MRRAGRNAVDGVLCVDPATGQRVQPANGLPGHSSPRNISRWCGDSERCEAQDLVFAALNTRCWQSMVKQGAPHESDAWAAFEGEVLPHADRLFRLAMWFERNRADAEDVVQETMMQALRSFHRPAGDELSGLVDDDPSAHREQSATSERSIDRRRRSRRPRRQHRPLCPARASGPHRRTRLEQFAASSDGVPGGHPPM